MENQDPQKKQAMITSMRLLAATAKSRAELAGRLKEKGYPDQVIQNALDDLEKQGFLNDRTYARNLKSRFTHGKPSGLNKIAFELKRHGISAAIREEVLSEINPEEERERAFELGRIRWNKEHKAPQEKRRQRVYSFLVRRGFSFSHARDVIETLERSAHEGG